MMWSAMPLSREVKQDGQLGFDVGHRRFEVEGDGRPRVLFGRRKSTLESSDSSALSSSDASASPCRCCLTTLELVQTTECSVREDREVLALAPALRLLVATGESGERLRSDVAIGALGRQVVADRVLRVGLSGREACAEPPPCSVGRPLQAELEPNSSSKVASCCGNECSRSGWVARDDGKESWSIDGLVEGGVSGALFTDVSLSSTRSTRLLFASLVGKRRLETFAATPLRVLVDSQLFGKIAPGGLEADVIAPRGAPTCWADVPALPRRRPFIDNEPLMPID